MGGRLSEHLQLLIMPVVLGMVIGRTVSDLADGGRMLPERRKRGRQVASAGS